MYIFVGMYLHVCICMYSAFLYIQVYVCTFMFVVESMYLYVCICMSLHLYVCSCIYNHCQNYLEHNTFLRLNGMILTQLVLISKQAV